MHILNFLNIIMEKSAFNNLVILQIKVFIILFIDIFDNLKILNSK